MATAEELLASLIGSEERVCVVDNDLRKINIPKTITALGVEADDDVHRLYFRMPRMYGDTDLSVFNIRINYMNANSEGDIYVVTDKQIGSSTITFSWLVGPHALIYKGDVRFIVCLKESDSGGAILREFNTTVATLPVLEGLEVDAAPLAGELADVLEQLLSLTIAKVAEVEAAGTEQVRKVQEKSEEEQENIKGTADYIRSTFGDDYDTTVKLHRTRANAIVGTAEGENMVLSDSSDDYLRGLKVFGKTTQVTTTGVQLFNAKNCEGVGSNNSINISDDEYTIVAVGGVSAGYSFSKFPLDASKCVGKTLTMSVDSFTGGAKCGVMLYGFVGGVNSLSYTLKPGDGSISCPIGEDIEEVKVYVYTNTSGTELTANNTAVIKGLMVSYGTNIWEPYSAGIKSPSPEWPQTLSSVANDDDSVKMEVYGGNLLNTPLLNVYSNTSLVVSSDTYTITAVGGRSNAYTSSTLSLSHLVNALRGKTVYFLMDNITCSNPNAKAGPQLNIKRAAYTDYTALSINSFRREILIPDDVEDLTLGIYTNNTASALTADNTVVIKGLRLGLIDTDWTPYNSQTMSATVTNGLPGIPVTSGGNYTDLNGQQWICDEVDFERGVYVQRIKSIVLDDSQYWWTYPGIPLEGNDYCYVVTLDDSMIGAYTSLCSHFHNTTYSWEYRYGGRYSDHPEMVNKYFISDKSTLANFVAWLCEQRDNGAPVMLTYILATPIETTLTDAELATFNSLHSNYPSTTVFNDAGAMMQLKYNADTKIYLNDCFRPTDDQVQAAVDAWLTANYASAEGAKF